MTDETDIHLEVHFACDAIMNETRDFMNDPTAFDFALEYFGWKTAGRLSERHRAGAAKISSVAPLSIEVPRIAANRTHYPWACERPQISEGSKKVCHRNGRC